MMEKRFGYTNTLVEIGGELQAKGKHILKNSSWTVAIDAPNEDVAERDLLRTLTLQNQALATSGNYRKFRIDRTAISTYTRLILLTAWHNHLRC